MDKLDERIIDFDKLREKADGMTETQRGEYYRTTIGIAIQLALQAVYMGERNGHGCGDQGHDMAMKHVLKSRRIMREL